LSSYFEPQDDSEKRSKFAIDFPVIAQNPELYQETILEVERLKNDRFNSAEDGIDDYNSLYFEAGRRIMQRLHIADDQFRRDPNNEGLIR